MPSTALYHSLEKFILASDNNNYYFKQIDVIVIPLIIDEIDYLSEMFKNIVNNPPFTNKKRKTFFHILLNTLPIGSRLNDWKNIVSHLKEITRNNNILITTGSYELKESEDIYFRNRHEKPCKDYIKKYGRLPLHGLKSGPNLMFLKTVKYAIEKDINAFLLMETDCLPLCNNWLGRIENEIKAKYSGQYTFGSLYRGIGNIGSEYQCHMNGNAVYMSGDEGFKIYYREVFHYIYNFV